MWSPAWNDVTGLGYQVEDDFRLPGAELLLHLIDFGIEGVFRIWPLSGDKFRNQVAKCFRVDAVPGHLNPILVSICLSRLRTVIVPNHYHFG